MIITLWIALAGLAIWFVIVLTRHFLAHRNELKNSSWLKTSIIGFVINFFDVLGIGHLHLKQPFLSLRNKQRTSTFPEL
jgi:hypothetical protein